MHPDQLWDLVKQSPQGKLFRYFIKCSQWDWRIGQSDFFWRAYSLFVARVASFGSERSEGANDSSRNTNKLYARQTSCDYHYHHYTWSNRTNIFHEERLFNMKSCCGLHSPNSIYSPHFAVWPAKRSVLEKAVCHLVTWSDNNIKF